jgi:hypothetical protein
MHKKDSARRLILVGIESTGIGTLVSSSCFFFFLNPIRVSILTDLVSSRTKSKFSCLKKYASS